MKKFIWIIIAILLLQKTNAQINEFSFTEKVKLTIDRNLYIIGENILFSGSLYTDIENNKGKINSEIHDNLNIDSTFKNISKVIYIEIITPNGESVNSQKYEIVNSKFTGNIKIPENILTGLYYIKAYTKYMRNFSIEEYDFVCIKVINPFKKDILDYKSSQNIPTQKTKEFNFFDVSIDSTYNINENINAIIDCNVESIKNINVSVIPADSYSNMEILIEENSRTKPKDFFYPETRGVTLTGKIIDKETGKTLPHTLINLSITGNKKDYIPGVSDSTGNFFFALPNIYNKKNIFLSSPIKYDIHPQILVHNDFCKKKIKIKTPAFKLTKAEEKLAYQFYLNKEINKIFNNDTIKALTDEKLTNAFYGQPSEVLYPSEYISLPTLEDCFFELPFHVKIYKKNKDKYLRIDGKESSLFVFEPLVLVDMVAVTDYDKVLSISPDKISRVEIVTAPYVKGIMVFGGIISIFSKNEDYGGIYLPKTGIFVDYDFLEKDIALNKTNVLLDKKPDTRNTLAWFPNLKLENKKTQISFKTSDIKGKYILLIQAENFFGEIITQKFFFKVQ